MLAVKCFVLRHKEKEIGCKRQYKREGSRKRQEQRGGTNSLGRGPLK